MKIPNEGLLLAILAVVTAPAVQSASPTIESVLALPNTVVVGTPTTITFTAAIQDPNVIPSGVNLLRVNPTGNPTIVGQLHDDGVNGDVRKADGIFTMQIALNEPQPVVLRYQISAAFRGVLARVTSPIQTITVQPVRAGVPLQTPFYRLTYPGNYHIETNQINSLHTGGPFDAFGLTRIVLRSDSSDVVSWIAIESTPNWGALSVVDLLAAVRLDLQSDALPGDTVDNTTLAGHDALQCVRPLVLGSGARLGYRQVYIGTAKRSYEITMAWSQADGNNLLTQPHKDFAAIVQSLVIIEN